MKKLPTIIISGLLALTLFVGMGACSEDGSLNLLFSVNDDIDLGEQLNTEIRSNPAEYPILDADQFPEAYGHIRRIMNTILASPDILYRDRFAYDSIKIIQDDETLNAFAAPGGYIYVYTGLIKFLDTEDQLAGVLGHEIAHAERRHGSDALQRQLGIQFLLDALLGNKTSNVTEILAGLGQLQFGRSAEIEADEFSVIYLSNSQSPYQCTGAAGFFEKLTAQGGSSGVPEFLSTHPNPGNRVENINATAASLGCSTEPLNPATYQDFKNSLP